MGSSAIKNIILARIFSTALCYESLQTIDNINLKGSECSWGLYNWFISLIVFSKAIRFITIKLRRELSLIFWWHLHNPVHNKNVNIQTWAHMSKQLWALKKNLSFLADNQEFSFKISISHYSVDQIKHVLNGWPSGKQYFDILIDGTCLLMFTTFQRVYFFLIKV